MIPYPWERDVGVLTVPQELPFPVWYWFGVCFVWSHKILLGVTPGGLGTNGSPWSEAMPWASTWKVPFGAPGPN